MRRTSPARIPKAAPKARAPRQSSSVLTFPSALAAITMRAPLERSNVALLAMTVRAPACSMCTSRATTVRANPRVTSTSPPRASPMPPIPTETRSARAMAIPPWTTEMSRASARVMPPWRMSIESALAMLTPPWRIDSVPTVTSWAPCSTSSRWPVGTPDTTSPSRCFSLRRLAGQRVIAHRASTRPGRHRHRRLKRQRRVCRSARRSVARRPWSPRFPAALAGRAGEGYRAEARDDGFEVSCAGRSGLRRWGRGATTARRTRRPMMVKRR